MKYYLFTALLLCNVVSFSQDIAQAMVPGIHDFVYVTEEPSPLNLPEVRKEIGYPTQAIDAGIEGKVICRVLVDQSGGYRTHMVTKSSHPLLMEAVDAHMEKLQFKPANKKGESVTFWVNIPFFFSLEEFGRSPSRDYEKLLQEGILFRDKGQYLTASAFFDRAVALGMKKSPEKVSAFMLKAHLEKAFNLYKLRKWEKARTSLTLSIGLAKDDPALTEFIPHLYLVRAWLALRAEQPIAAISDFNWLNTYFPDFHPTESSFEHSPYTSPGDYSKLIAACSEALTFQKNTPLAYWTRGLCKQKLKDLEGAASEYEALAEMNPESVLAEQALNTAALMFLLADQPGPALSILVRVTERFDKNPKGHYLKGMTLVRLTHFEEGHKSLKMAIGLGLEEEEEKNAKELLTTSRSSRPSPLPSH